MFTHPLLKRPRAWEFQSIIVHRRADCPLPLSFSFFAVTIKQGDPLNYARTALLIRGNNQCHSLMNGSEDNHRAREK